MRAFSGAMGAAVGWPARASVVATRSRNLLAAIQRVWETAGLVSMNAPDSAPSTADARRAAKVSRRGRPTYRVFVSSTWLDLQPERAALMAALHRMEEMRFVGMEFFGNRPDDTHDASIDQVDSCDVFVGIIGFRYGSGITEAEYRRARSLGLPCFLYFKREADRRPELTDNNAERAEKLAGLKAELLRSHTVKEFASPEELAANATADLHNWVAARWVATEPVAPAGEPLRAAVPEADRTNLLRLLERIEHDWIKGVLEASLHHRAWLELGLDWRDEAVALPWDRIVVAQDRPIRTLAREDSIAGVFAAAQHTLLVLGEPGAGKTTTLLELARDLIERARFEPAEPVPVVLALTTWSAGNRDFGAWLATELGLRYQVPKRLAQDWLENGRLVLLLDGLDEVGAAQRAACVEAINAFGATHPPPGLAVTCRVAEYGALTVKLRLRAAISLEPLTADQVERHFAAAGPALEPLRRALQDDAALRELARTPLMLSVMTLAWRDVPVSAPTAAAPEERRRQLFEAYVQAALNRRGKVANVYPPERTLHWLGWVAGRMKAHDQTLFSLEQLQPAWLPGAADQMGYCVATRVMGAVALGMPILIWNTSWTNRLSCLGLAAVLGFVLAGIDWGFLRRSARGGDPGSLRFWTMLLAMFLTAAGWISVVLQNASPTTRTDSAVAYGLAYLIMAAFAFCAPVDVRGLDIQTSDSMRWSWRLAAERMWVGAVGINLLLFVVFGSTVVAVIRDQGWQAATGGLGGGWFVAGIAVGAATGGALAVRMWRKGRVLASAVAAAAVSLGGQLGVTAAAGVSKIGWWLVVEAVIAVGIGVYGGFVADSVDPRRPRRAGLGFWLRVPLLAFAVVGVVVTVPVAVWAAVVAVRRNVPLPADLLPGLLTLGLGVGLVAFLKFGGFSGLQHLVLRRLLVRGGHLPAAAETFFDYAAQAALLQKVGYGYRFVHALLLDHLAEGGRTESRGGK